MGVNKSHPIVSRKVAIKHVCVCVCCVCVVCVLCVCCVCVVCVCVSWGEGWEAIIMSWGNGLKYTAVQRRCGVICDCPVGVGGGGARIIYMSWERVNSYVSKVVLS